MSHDLVPLTCFSNGQTVDIEWLGVTDEEATRLRELGVREGCRACILMNSDKCILGLGACRIALRRELAMQLFVKQSVAL